MNIPERNESIQSLESLCQCAIRISQNTQGREGVTWRVMIASLVFCRITLHGLSILRLTPGSSFCQPVQGMQIWDLASVASLSRNLVEAYLTLHYMLEPLSTNGEIILCENVWRYHETFERLKI